MKQIEENYRFKFVTDYFKPYKVSPSDPIWKDLPATYDEMMREFTNIVIREQESSRNVVQNAVFDLNNTKSGQRGEKLSVNAAKIDKKQDKPKTEIEPVINSVKGDQPFVPKVPYCRLGCKDKSTGKTAKHFPENCYHPLMTDSLRAAHKTERQEYLKGNKLEKQVKQLAGTEAAKKATGKTVAAAKISSESNAQPTRDYRQFFYDDDDEPDVKISSLQINSMRIPSKRTRSIFPKGIKLGQLDNGANATIINIAEDLIDVKTTEPTNIQGWSTSSDGAVNMQGKLPGFGTVYISPKANCIFSESQFLTNGWVEQRKYGIDPQTSIKMPMEIHLQKTGPNGEEILVFKRDSNYLWYAPYSDIMKHIKLTGDFQASSFNNTRRNIHPKIAAIITRNKGSQPHTTAHIAATHRQDQRPPAKQSQFLQLILTPRWTPDQLHSTSIMTPKWIMLRHNL
jgi:hypothetical protein